MTNLRDAHSQERERYVRGCSHGEPLIHVDFHVSHGAPLLGMAKSIYY